MQCSVKNILGVLDFLVSGHTFDASWALITGTDSLGSAGEVERITV